MRRMPVIVIVVVWIIGVLPLFGVLASAPSTDGNTSIVVQATPAPNIVTPATCKDPRLLTLLGGDLNTFAKSFKALDLNKKSDVMKAALDAQDLRRKWEEMTDVPDNCIELQLQAVIVFGSAGDITGLILASIVDSTNSSTYAESIKGQTDRFNKLLDELVQLAPAG